MRPFVPLMNQYVCASCRRVGSDLVRQPGFRPLHASPVFQRPRRRDFFSSNTLLSQPKPPDPAEIAETSSDAQKAAATQKRRTARSPAAKTSLRRVAVEAQRSKDGNLSSSRRIPDDASVPKLLTAYAVAEEFNLAKVVEILRSKGYEPDPLKTGLYPQVVHVQIPISSIYRSFNTSARDLSQSEVGDVFVFPSGTLVTWALPEGFTSYLATRTLLPAAVNPHVDSIETEDLDYIEDPSREHSSIRGDTIVLGVKGDTQPSSDPQSAEDSQIQTIDTVLTKIAFSSGFARSTKLAVLESNLETYLHSTALIPRLMSQGARLPRRISRPFILQKTGQLLSLRAQLNLYSELTDSLPDLFWDSKHELNLENYYDQVGRALDAGIRIKVLNEKMDYAQEIARVLRETLSERHGTFLEWTIIVLIAIEVGFEVLRLEKEGFWSDLAAGGQRPKRQERS
jgi:required for meiotic nuclear division protein 1